MITRNLDWQIDFANCVAENMYKPFEWGSHDCMLWAANLVSAITGYDPAIDFRGEYISALGAARLLKEVGGMEAVTTLNLGSEPISKNFANVGDIMLVLQEGQPMLAVCNGETMLAPGPFGLVSLPTLSAEKAWRV